MIDRLLMLAFKGLGEAEGALANANDHLQAARTKIDLTECGRATRNMARASETNRTAIRNLLDSPDKGSDFAGKLLSQLQTQRKSIYELQEAIPAFLNGLSAHTLPVRIGRLLASAPRGLTCEQIAEALRTECVQIAEARADWKLAMGAGCAWVVPQSSPDAYSVKRLLKKIDGIERRFLGRRYRAALAA